MVEKIKNESEKIKSNEKLDFKNDKAYKYLEKNFDKLHIKNKEGKKISKKELAEFYKKIKTESIKAIEDILDKSKNTNLIKLFGSKQKFANEIFEKYLSIFLNKDINLNIKGFTKENWNFRLGGLLEFNYKSKDDFLNTFINYYGTTTKKEIDFIKNIWGNENISWQQAQKLDNILATFETGENYKNSISGKLNKENITLLSQLNRNLWDLPDFTDKKYFGYLKNLGLIQNNGKIDVNTAIQIIAFLQGKTDKILDINGNELSKDKKNKLFIYSLANIDIDFKDKILNKKNNKIFGDEIAFLIRNVGLDKTSNLIDIYFKKLSIKNKLLNRTAGGPENYNKSVNEVIKKLSINIGEKNKDEFLKIIKNLFPKSNYNKNQFEKDKSANIQNFILLFTNSSLNTKEIEKNINNYVNNEFNKGTENNEFEYKQIEGFKPKIKTFLGNFFKQNGGINELKKQISKGNVKDPINYMIQTFIKDYKFKKSFHNEENEEKKLLYKLFYHMFTKYAEKFAKNSKTESIIGSETFSKVEKNLELNSQNINPFQASIVSYYLCKYSIEKNNGKIDNNLLNSPGFKKFLMKNIGINIDKNKKKGKFMNTTDFDNDFFSNLNLGNDSFIIDKKTIENFKTNNKLEKIVEQYQQMGYEGYIQYEENIENEKKLLQGTGAISKKIASNKSILFKNSNENTNNIEIKSTEINGVHIIESKLPGTNKIIQVESLTKEEGNKSLIKEITGEQFGINISFDNWSADDFSKIINTDITKGILTGEDMKNIKKFYQTYAVKLVENGNLPKNFLIENNLKISDIYNNFDNFSKAFSSWMKSHLSLGGIKPLGNEFYIDSFDHTIKEVINEKYKWNKIKEEILDNQNIGIIGKFKNFFGKIKI